MRSIKFHSVQMIAVMLLALRLSIIISQGKGMPHQGADRRTYEYAPGPCPYPFQPTGGMSSINSRQ